MKFLVLLFLVGFAAANIHQEQEEEERTFAEFLNNLGNDIKGKYTKFKEWAADTFKKGLDKGESGLETIKAIANQFIDNADNVSIDVAHEAKEFFSKHKKDLGPLWHKVMGVLKNLKGLKG